MNNMVLLSILAGILLVGGILTYVLFKKYKSVSSNCTDGICKPKQDTQQLPQQQPVCVDDVCTKPTSEIVEPVDNTTFVNPTEESNNEETN
jgi:hypothetical protein